MERKSEGEKGRLGEGEMVKIECIG